jgi:hypothetical protein
VKDYLTRKGQGQ